MLAFEYLFNENVNATTCEIMMSGADLNTEDKEYMVTLYRGVIAHHDDLITYIEKFLINFPIYRVNVADKAILLLAVYEMIYVDSVPPSVSINEAVEISKKYSTEKSPAFVNGILASVFKDKKGDKNNG